MSDFHGLSMKVRRLRRIFTNYRRTFADYGMFTNYRRKSADYVGFSRIIGESLQIMPDFHGLLGKVRGLCPSFTDYRIMCDFHGLLRKIRGLCQICTDYRGKSANYVGFHEFSRIDFEHNSGEITEEFHVVGS